MKVVGSATQFGVELVGFGKVVVHISVHDKRLWEKGREEAVRQKWKW